MAADLVRLLGDPWIGDLDLGRMEQLPTEYVSNDLRTRRATCPGGRPQARHGPPRRRGGDVPHRIPAWQRSASKRATPAASAQAVASAPCL